MVTAAILQYVINFILGVVELLLGLRVILKLFGANPAAPFVNWVYETSSPLIEPFRGMFPHPVLQGGYIVEFSTIFALFIYALIAYLLGELIEFVQFNATRYYRRR